MAQFLNDLSVVITSCERASELLADPATRDEIGSVVSIADSYAGQRPKREDFLRVPYHLALTFDDVDKDSELLEAATMQDIVSLLYFSKQIMQSEGKLLIHCAAGISRSAAAAFILLADYLGEGKEAIALETARVACEIAFVPNQHMVALADEILCRNGAMVRVVADYYRQLARLN